MNTNIININYFFVAQKFNHSFFLPSYLPSFAAARPFEEPESLSLNQSRTKPQSGSHLAFP